MTLGPSVPDSKGRSADLPVALSVSVTVSLAAGALAFDGAVFVSIGCNPQRCAVALQYPLAPQHKPLGAAKQTPAIAVAAWSGGKKHELDRHSYRAASGRFRDRVVETGEGLVAAQHGHDLEDWR